MKTSFRFYLLTVLTLILTFPLLSQQQPRTPQPPDTVDDEPRREPWIEIDSVALQTSGYSLRVPRLSGGNPNSIWYLASGGAADASVHLPGRLTRLILNYRAGYSWNPKYSTLNGLDHAVSLSFRRPLSRQTTFRIESAFESRLVTTALFDTSTGQRLAQGSLTGEQLAEGLTGGAGSLAGSSPIDLMLFGARITAGSVNAGFTHIQSPKIEWTGNVGGSRVIRGSSADPVVAAQYPTATMLVANVGMSYAISRQTRLLLQGNHMGSRSQRYRFDWDFGSADLQRMIGRRAFAHVQGGYGVVFDRATGGDSRKAYLASVGIGAILNDHTIVASIRRGGADYRGMGVDTSLGFEAGWAWAPPRSMWSLGSSAGYERLSGVRTAGGDSMLNMEAEVFRGTVTRRLTFQTMILVEAAYVNSSSRVPALLTGGGFRIAYVWMPSGPPRRGT